MTTIDRAASADSGRLDRPAGIDHAETARTALIAREIRVRHGAGPWVLDGADLVLRAGSVIGLAGPSGVGKSTLARVLAGLQEPQAGTVQVNGEAQAFRRGAMSGQVAMLFQSPRRSSSPRLTISEHLREAAELRGLRPGPDEVATAAERVGLTLDLLGRRTTQVSEGQLQRACLARALLAQPTYLLCDEATAMLDPVTTATITGVVRDLARAGVGVLAISHDAELLAAWADETYTLRDGTLTPASR